MSEPVQHPLLPQSLSRAHRRAQCVPNDALTHELAGQQSVVRLQSKTPAQRPMPRMPPSALSAYDASQ